MQTPEIHRKTRVIDLSQHHRVMYIKHLGVEPYNEIKFDCGKIVVVGYSLSYWHTVFRNFRRINHGVLINPNKIISEFGTQEVELSDNSKFMYSRRKLKKALLN